MIVTGVWLMSSPSFSPTLLRTDRSFVSFLPKSPDVDRQSMENFTKDHYFIVKQYRWRKPATAHVIPCSFTALNTYWTTYWPRG